VLVSLVLALCLGFLMPALLSMVGSLSSASSTYLPTRPTADSEPCTTASTLPSILDSLWKIIKDKVTTSDNSPNWKIPLIFFLPPQSFHALLDSAHTSLINKLCFSNHSSVLCLHVSPYFQAACYLAMTHARCAVN